MEFCGVCQIRFEIIESLLILLGPPDLMWDPIFRQFSKGFGRLCEILDVRLEIGEEAQDLADFFFSLWGLSYFLRKPLCRDRDACLPDPMICPTKVTWSLANWHFSSFKVKPDPRITDRNWRTCCKCNSQPPKKLPNRQHRSQ